MTAVHLITYFGTLVYYDESAAALRHGEIGRVPLNVTADLVGTELTFFLEGSGGRTIIGDLGPAGCRSVKDDIAPVRLQAASHQQSHYTFHWAGRVLTAEQEGHVSLSRSRVGDWEMFLLLDRAEFDELHFVLCNAWIQRTPQRLFESREMTLVPRFKMAVGDHVIDLKDILSLVRGPAARRPRTALELSVHFDNWKLLSLRLFRPLIYLVAYGRDDIFECAALALKSLRRWGGWQADIRIITDRAHAAIGVAPGLERVEAIAVQASDTLDFALARYKAVNIAELRQFQPVLYIDTDVVCNASLDMLYQQLCFSDALHALFEAGSLLTPEDYYGKTLFDRDPGVGSGEEFGMSTGVLAFRNMAGVEDVFRAVLSSAYAFSSEVLARNFFPAFDQPFANYVFKKSLSVVESLQQWAEVNLYIHEPSQQREDRLGLIHFAGGVGNATPKIDRMRSYLAMLDGSEPTTDTAEAG